MRRRNRKATGGRRTLGSTTAGCIGRGFFRRPDIDRLEHRLLLAGGNYLPTLYDLVPLGGLLSGPAAGDPLTIARSFLQANAASLGLSPAAINSAKITNQYTSQPSGMTHIYMRQMHNGLEVVGADLSITVAADGRVVSAGSRFLAGLPTTSLNDDLVGAIPAVDTLQKAANALGFQITVTPEIRGQLLDLAQTTILAAPNLSRDDIPVRLYYVPTGPATVELAWNLRVRTPDGQQWLDIGLDARDGSVLYQTDWVSHAAYEVFASPLRSPQDGGRTIELDPHDPTASPFGWHDVNGIAGPEFTITRGNNVYASEDRDGNFIPGFSPDGGGGLSFLFPFADNQPPSFSLSAAITNLFYWTNLLHDVHYHYGFDEAAGNFQSINYTGQGLGGDPVMAFAQEFLAFNNAFMATPPDGSSPILAMGLFFLTFPQRDSDFDNSIIVHEYGHGVSNRLAGGPANSNALDALQSGGMGEGWSDFWSLMFGQTANETKDSAIALGNYVLGFPPNGPGIRRFPYSFNMSINPLTYGDYNQSSEVHDSGEIWASALWDMNWLLIDKYGFNPDISQGYTGAGSAGNILALQLVMDALKLQPVNPSFLDGRDAILAADLALTGGENQEAIWTAFARRGMGFSANDGGSANAETVVEAFDIPLAVSIGDASVVEGDAGTSQLVFQVTLNRSSGTTVSVTVSTRDGTAVAPADYASLTQQVVFNPGETSKTVVVDVVGEGVLERDETLFVELSGASGAVIFKGRGTGTIIDDDNTAPIAVDDMASTAIGVPVGILVLANDSDPDVGLDMIDPTSVRIVSKPLGGTVAVDPVTGSVTYFPNPGFSGTDTFNYTVDDSFGKTSNVATVTVKVLLPPVAVDDATATPVGVFVDVLVLANDFDLDSPLDPTSVVIVNGPTFGTAVAQPDGRVVYTPQAGFAGGDLFSYRVRDVDGLLSNIANVRIRVGAAVSISGDVYVDFNQNGRRDASEQGIAGTRVVIQKIDGPITFSRELTVDANGRFELVENLPQGLILPQGVYHIIEIHPTIFLDGADRAGTIAPPGGPLNDAFLNLFIPAGTAASGYQFGELGLKGAFVAALFPLGITSSMQLVSTSLSGSVLYSGLNLAAGSQLLAFDQGWSGTLSIAAQSLTGGGSVNLTLLDAGFQIVGSAASATGGTPLSLARAGTQGVPHYVLLSGTNGNVNLQLTTPAAAAPPTPVNVAPQIDPIAPQVLDVGQSLDLLVTARDPDGGKLLYLLGPGAPQGATLDSQSGRLRWTATHDSPNLVTIPIIVYDDGQPQAADVAFVAVTVRYVGPVPSITVPSTIVAGQVARFTLWASSATAGPGASFVYQIDWNGDGATDEVWQGPSGLVVDHVFQQSGTHSMRVAAGQAGGFGPASVRTLVVAPAGGAASSGSTSPNPSNAALTGFHNPRQALDVNDDGFISPLDALLIINRLNLLSASGYSAAGPPVTGQFLDTSGDGLVTPLDALLILNEMNARAALAAAAPGAGLAAAGNLTGDSTGDSLGLLPAAGSDDELLAATPPPAELASNGPDASSVSATADAWSQWLWRASQGKRDEVDGDEPLVDVLYGQDLDWQAFLAL